jgi:alpha-amylase
MITQDDVIYFALTDRFDNGDPGNDAGRDLSKPGKYHGGDFAGLIGRIPYLQKLGITAVWITPVYLSIGALDEQSDGYHGYWALDFEKVDPRLYSAQSGRVEGSREYLKELVETLHAARIKVILDMVVNHTGYHNEAYRTYPDKKITDDMFNRGTGVTEEELAGLPDLDHDQPRVVDYFVHNILDWIEDSDIDAIRMDTVKHVEDTFWYFFKSCVKTRYPGLTLIGEVLDLDPRKVGRYQQENDFDTLFDFPLRQTMVDTFVWDQPMTRLARPRLHEDEPRGTLDFETPYTNANRLVTLLDNHDLERRIASEVLLRTHGQRSELALDILRLCLAFQLTTRGIPQIYYGTEIAMEGGRDPDNRRDMPWQLLGPDHRPVQARPFERVLFDHTARLIRLRHEHPAIRYGYLLTLFVDHFLYGYLREFRGDVVLVLINNGTEPMPHPVTLEIGANSNIPPRVKDLLEGLPLESHTEGIGDIVVRNGQVQVQVPGKTAAIFAV